MNTNNSIRHNRGATRTQTLIASVAVAVVIIVFVAVYLSRRQPEPIPEPGRPLETVQPAKSAEERGDTARAVIERLEANATGPDYAEAHARAKEFQADGQLADAQLLYFFAARGGYAPAAFDLATANDPNHQTSASSLAAAPDPFQAYRWYTAARDAGHPGASERLEELRVWAEAASHAGDQKAEQLFLQWEQAP
jgi:TPR repeat protein